MKKLLIPMLFTCLLACFSCEELNAVLEETGLTDEEIVEGLKEALSIGTDNSVSSASAQDGYLQNEVIKILLPDQVKSLQTKIETGSISLFGGAVNVPYTTILDAYVAITPELESDPFEELIVAMNRGAEKAADKALPIFGNAITNMTISDGLAILQGDSTAATQYFYDNTNEALFTAFQPEVVAALGDTQASAIYEKTVGFMNYEYTVNYVISSVTFKVSDYLTLEEELPATLDEYATTKAIDGLFTLVGDEEKKIRKDPFAWASDIIARVFGSDEAKGN